MTLSDRVTRFDAVGINNAERRRLGKETDASFSGAFSDGEKVWGVLADTEKSRANYS